MDKIFFLDAGRPKKGNYCFKLKLPFWLGVIRYVYTYLNLSKITSKGPSLSDGFSVFLSDFRNSKCGALNML